MVHIRRLASDIYKYLNQVHMDVIEADISKLFCIFVNIFETEDRTTGEEEELFFYHLLPISDQIKTANIPKKRQIGSDFFVLLGKARKVVFQFCLQEIILDKFVNKQRAKILLNYNIKEQNIVDCNGIKISQLYQAYETISQ